MTRNASISVAASVAAASVVLGLVGCAEVDPHGDFGDSLGTLSAAVAAPPDCTHWGCGSNTALINDHPVEALDLKGEQKVGRFELVPHSLRVLGQPEEEDSYVLHYEDGELVGTNEDGEVVVWGDELIGASFKLLYHGESGTPEDGTIVISKRAAVPLFIEFAPATPDEPPEYRYVLAYEFIHMSASTQAKPVCPSVRPWDAFHTYEGAPKHTWDHPKRGLQTESVLHPDQAGQYAVLLVGERYHADTAKVLDNHSWLTIACSGTALSKMKLMGYDPTPRTAAHPSSTALERQATLRMLTARYCGHDKGLAHLSFTDLGVPLAWQNSAGWFELSGHGAIEAMWDSQGPVCLDAPRLGLWTREDVKDLCGYEIPTCEGMSLDQKHVVWASYHRL
ncbi:MAG: ADYC domain-containing protein [Myxococcota bacterium]